MKALKLALLVAIPAISLLINSAALAADVKDRLFAEATAARQAANEHDGVKLAPDTYARAARAYRNAEKKFSEARSMDRVQRDLDKAVKEFRKAEFSAELAQQNLATVIKARADAETVQASQYSAKEWSKAESGFRSAVSNHEDGRLSSAKQYAETATKNYRAAELTSIKTMYLAETGMLIEKAKKNGATKFAPQTWQKAVALLAEAETVLTENRYDIDKPRSLARQANYEARHAIHLTGYLKHAKRMRRTPEDLVLEWESPLQQIAAAADMNAEFDNGYEGPVAVIIAYIEDRYASSHELEQQIVDRNDEILVLNREVDTIQGRLGGATRSRADLQDRLRAQERLRQQVKQIEGTFKRQEAQVFRDSNEIYLRLVGLSFASGSSNIGQDNYQMLDKVQEAIRVFPDSQVVIEGHTDSYGGDDENMTLSEQRAESVQRYLKSQMALRDEYVNAVGYGETRPVANNETPQGRARNRRIDVRIVPNLDTVADLTAATFDTGQ
jgi:OOP family OmpA-OmpF porin